ncbi:alpha-glucosidase [Cellvibrio zantedeschiae]|uniref:Alpha-glucosidase n=1 Tax=Cellvibrio zantedeschiae TaxID=1237077 RepID=A0ABQ3AUQ5_9GAMM|nr:glycoside hydrolase family 97 protein [Cellvibrio zantedeschiae]GGY64712.1 alpha-glucosidase [Cellvibrio zantedeschiae]
MKKRCLGVTCLLLVSCAKNTPQDISSPDKHLQVHLSQSEQGSLQYSVLRDGKPIVKTSALGLELTDADFTKGLTIKNTSPVKAVSDDYEMMVGKKHKIHYQANEQTISLKNAAGQDINVTFRLSNDGVAFRYQVPNPGKKHLQFKNETTSFSFAENAKAWMQPMSVAQTGWSNTNPSYEEPYVMDTPVGTVSPSPAGWVFPALYKTDDTWVAITEVNMDGSFHASRLQAESTKGEYKIGLPMAAEVFTGGNLLAESHSDLISPWRVLAIGNLPTVMESTLGTDLADKAIPFDKKYIQPGHASWSWAILKDDFTVFDVQKKFIDYAVDMKWDYTLIDADWDKKIGYEKMKELVDYAKTKNIGIILWYNSSGDWNQTPYSPKSKLITHEQRVKEFALLREMGVKGLKIDFFGGDGRSMIAYYIDILKDAAAEGLLINFHGATLPRGWQRTYPNLMTMEAIKGFEFATFTQANQDAVPTHAAMAPFARNLFDPMDFTPMAFGDIPNIKRATRNGFELAESVLFISGIQHFAEIPEGMATAPDYVKAFLQDLPRSWEEVKFLDGVPGKHVVIARKSGDTWYVAGLNGDGADENLTLDLSFIGNKKGTLITDGATEREFSQSEIASDKATVLNIKSHGGFVAVFK